MISKSIYRRTPFRTLDTSNPSAFHDLSNNDPSDRLCGNAVYDPVHRDSGYVPGTEREGDGIREWSQRGDIVS